MKRLHFVAIATTVLFLSGCMKKDVRFYRDTATKCNVAQYPAVGYDGLSYGNGMKKTFNEFGWAKTLTMAIAANFNFVDSVYCYITYRTVAPGRPVVATIQVLKRHYEIDGENLYQSEVFPDDENYTLTAWFDPHQGYLTKIAGDGGWFPGTFVMTYSPGGRLLKFGGFVLEYDAQGNISRVPAKDGSGHGALIYAYDLTRTGKSQFYLTSGYNVHEYYNLAEACHWIPVQPKNVRISQTISWGQNDEGEDYIAGGHAFIDQVFDAKGYLISYKTFYPFKTVYNTWTCKNWDLK